MAKFRTAIIAAALFCLFTVSLARSPLDLTVTAAQVALPLRDDAPAQRLPSEPINDADAKTNAETDPSFAVVSSAPMTRITFRPINRLFLKRPCRLHFKFYPTMRDNQHISLGNDMIIASGENTDFKQPTVRDNRQISLGKDMIIASGERDNQQLGNDMLIASGERDNQQLSLGNGMLIASGERDNHQISLGNDMLIASGENTDFKQPAVHGGGNRIPERWMRMHHHLRHRRSNEEEVDRVKKAVFKRYDYDCFDREKKLKKLRQRFMIRNKIKEEKPKKSPFFKGVRKFLNSYF
ncbi:hypothetical protein SASPL_150694 [Salvia splendens]|uniref:Uncharacterized protein n=1 Tax=Salvia splendens TaxID=180675 RepID=A0A8X8Z1Z3_SALSN|nr:hypothetical protein SASPL_150694 [Salvia splendens]